MRLKRWESPRCQGRNDKGKGGVARQRQLKKREKLLRKQLKSNQNNSDGRKNIPPFIFINNYLRLRWAKKEYLSVFYHY